MKQKVLFISEAGYLRSDIRGGVQLCTDEYIRYIRLVGYDVQEFPVKPSFSLVNRIKIKLRLDTYEHYDVAPYIDDLVKAIKSSPIKLVFVNQVSLSPWVETLKKHVPADVKFIGLSHGNESADYLNDITKPGKPAFLQTWKLGKLLVKENHYFSALLDGVVVLSEQEVAINNWIGANNVLYLPRILEPGFLDWKPKRLVAGFAGTLDHIPNLHGIRYLAKALSEIKFNGKLRIVGGPRVVGENFERQYPFIEYAGPIDDDELVKEVATWSMSVNPVFWYARGASTKLAQAINWGIPCLTTPAGRRGYELADESIVTADNTPKTFAQAMAGILADQQRVINLKTASETNARAFNPEPFVIRLQEFISLILGQPKTNA